MAFGHAYIWPFMEFKSEENRSNRTQCQGLLHISRRPLCLLQLFQLCHPLHTFPSSPQSYLHQVRCYHAPAAHEVEQWAGFTPHNSEHGITKSEQVKCTSPVLGGFYFSYKGVKQNKQKRKQKAAPSSLDV